jgi:hydroxymethylbilane synthase
MMGDAIRLGTRGSKLALWQTNFVAASLARGRPGLAVATQIIATTGDKAPDRALTKIDDQGLFTKELEKALLAGAIDAAVHSLKDLPTVIPDGLCLGAVLKRHDPRDALVARSARSLAELPPGARVGSGSPRRVAQLRALRPDLLGVAIRGNLDTRLRKLDESGAYDAIIVARAGLDRLGLSPRAAESFAVEQMLPAPGQGALAVECRADDANTRARLALLDDADSAAAVRAERAFLRILEGGCRVPIGAFGELHGGEMRLSGVVASLDGERLLRADVRGSKDDPEALGAELAAVIRRADADGLLAEIFAAARAGGAS